MKTLGGIILLTLCVSVAVPAGAQTVEELRQQLEAQKAINERLRQRVEQLEGQDSDGQRPALRPLEPARAATTEAETPEATTAILEALVARGLVLLPPESYRFGSGLSWSHSGSEANRTASDDYTARFTLQGGLPRNMMFSASVPYAYRDTASGSNSGVGDLFFVLSKELTEHTEGRPSLVASLGYQERNGKDPFAQVPIGSGFRALSARLSAIKRLDPVALYGDITYTYPFGRDVRAQNVFGEETFLGHVNPGPVYGLGLGASLAATPEISLDAELSLAFVGSTEVDSSTAGSFRVPKATVAFLTFGSGFVLTRRLSLLMSASAGATKDAPDLILSVNLPYRF